MTYVYNKCVTLYQRKKGFDSGRYCIMFSRTNSYQTRSTNGWKTSGKILLKYMGRQFFR